LSFHFLPNYHQLNKEKDDQTNVAQYLISIFDLPYPTGVFQKRVKQRKLLLDAATDGFHPISES